MYHAGLLAAASEAGARVRGGCRVGGIRRSASGFELRTKRGRLAAREVVIATNAYTGPESPWHRRRLVATNAFMAATAPLDPALLAKLMPSRRIYIDYSRHMSNYWRPAPDSSRLLFGGQTGVMHRTPERMGRLLHADLERVFPELAGARFTHLWQGRLAMTMDRLPHLGVRNGIHFALGCTGAGLPMGTYIGHKIAKKLLGDADGKTPFDDRSFPVSPSLLGYPWYLPVRTAWARFQDWRGVAAKGH
jgi:glycine/D-amino acid oxidase-like deaminating enzyme